MLRYTALPSRRAVVLPVSHRPTACPCPTPRRRRRRRRLVLSLSCSFRPSYVVAGILAVAAVGGVVQYYRIEAARELILSFYDRNDRIATASLKAAREVWKAACCKRICIAAQLTFF